MAEAAFDPDLFLAQTAPKRAGSPAQSEAFDPDKFLADTAPPENPKPSLSPVDKAFQVVEDAGSSAMQHPWVKGPLEWAGDKFERYLDAPVRAQVGAIQRGIDPERAAEMSWEQFGKKTLPTTDDAKTIMSRTGLSTTGISESLPSLFSDTGEGLKLKRGGILDVSPAGVAGGLMQPSTWALPGEAIIGAGGKAVGATAKGVAKVGEKFVSPVLVTADKAADLGKKAVFRTGQVMTGGNLDAGRAFSASEKLSGTEMLLPEGYLGKAGKAVGEARDAITDSTVAPGSRQALEQVKEILINAEKRALRTPQSQAVLDKIETLLESGEDIPVQTVDDLVRNLDDVGWTQQGNKRSLHPMWGKPVSDSRRVLNDLLPSTPEGQALQGAKSKFSELTTAQGKGGSKLRGIMSFSGAPAAIATGVASSNPFLAAAAFAASRAIAPRTYFQIVGAAKLPKQAVNALMDSYATGKVGQIKQVMADLASQYPEEITRIAASLSKYAEESAGAVAEDERNPINRRIKRLGE